MTSVRESLNIVGQAVSIKELARQRKESFPLSLRNFVGAPPPGQILQKVISLEFLQRKLDVFFNQRIRPIFQIRIDSKEHKFGQSALTIAMYDPVKEEYDHDNPLVSQELAGPGEVLDIPGVIYGTHRIYFQNVNSDGVSLNVVPGQLVGLEIAVHFETGGGIEIKVEDWNASDIDLTGFKIKLKMEFGSKNGLIDLVGFIDEVDDVIKSAKISLRGDFIYLVAHFRGEVIKLTGPKYGENFLKGMLKEALIKRFINTDVSVDTAYPDGKAADAVEKSLNSKIYEALQSSETRNALNKMVTRWLVGGDFHVTAVSNNDQSLSVNYMIPPGQLEPFPENPQTPLDPGLLANIDHIVVLMMENRSFDHMLGYLSKDGDGNGKKHMDIEGLHHGKPNSDMKGHSYASLPLPDTRFNESPDHSHIPVENQINGGKMDGFVSSFIAKFPNIENPGKIMGYHTAANVPVYDKLAQEFLICNYWFAAHPGPTFCNRFYTLTGRLNRDSFGLPEVDNFKGNDFKPVPTRTIFDHLSDHGISWRFYEHRYCSLRMYGRYTLDDTYIVDADDPLKGFYASAASAQEGALPSVSFIDPNFIDEHDGLDNDDGPPADIAAGQNLIGKVVDAVINSPKWNKILLLITYDEHGGFYDHVDPLKFSSNTTSVPVSGINHYGVRVPTFVVSPWVDQAAVSNVVFDHTSIAKTIAKRFMGANPPDMGERVAAANDLSMVLRSTLREDRPIIPVPPAPAPNLAFAANATPVDEIDDFKEIMRTMRARYPIDK